MAISKEEVKKLADLARIEMNDAEVEILAKEINPILDYVAQIKSVTNEEGADFPSPEQGLPAMPARQAGEGHALARGGVNVMREDANPTESGTYSKELIAEFPEREGDYLKVKKIL